MRHSDGIGLRQIPVGPGRLAEVLAELGVVEERRFWVYKDANLETYWAVILLPDGYWHAVRVWVQPYLPGWILFAGEYYSARGGDDAVYQFRESRLELDVKAAEGALARGEDVEDMHEWLAESRAKLKALRVSTN